MIDAPQTQTAAGVMTLEEFIRRSDQEGPFEIINGEIIPKMPNVFGHNKTANYVSFAINNFSVPRSLGWSFVEGTFIRPENYVGNWVKGSRIPDAMYFTQERLDEYQQSIEAPDAKPLMMIPDIAIEVVLPNDSYTDINDKVARYLQDGVRLVWVFDPQVCTVTVHLPGSSQLTYLSGDAILTGGEVIPGFEVKLSDIFGK